MPWVEKEECIGCGICVEKCPVHAIILDDGAAEIHMGQCIHCGTCHTACPQDAVKHDSKRIPAEITENVNKTKRFMRECAEHLGDEKEAGKCLERMIRHFNKEKTVAEKTLDALNELR